jgi:putative transposase
VKGIEKEFLRILYDTIKKYPTLHVFTANTDRDHVHIQIELPPSIPVSSVVQKLKAATSQHLRKKFRVIQEIYLDKEGIWSVGYFVSSVGLNETQIKQYINWQGKRDWPRTIRTSKQLKLEFS